MTSDYRFHPPLLLLACSLLWLPWTVTDFRTQSNRVSPPLLSERIPHLKSLFCLLSQSTSEISKPVPQDLCSSLELRFVSPWIDDPV